MNIGIDATSWWNIRGFGRFTRELLTALLSLDSPHRFYLIVDQPPEDAMLRDNAEILQVMSARPTTAAAVADSSRSPRDLFRLYRAVSSSPIDIMFFPAVYSWFPTPRRVPTMVTLHDAIAEHFPELIFDSRRSRLFWSIKVKLALGSSRRILTVSEAARQEIIDYLGVDPSIIDVTSEAPSPVFRPCRDEALRQSVRQRSNLPQDARIILYVGGLAPHKNLDGLLEGFRLANESAELDDVHMALVGDYGGAGFYSNFDALDDKVQSDTRLRNRVHFTGHLPDADLVVLYSDALALAMPSFSEGFGLPAVEAMACAAPVLASNQGSLPEVVAQGGLYFDPADAPGIAQAITRISSDGVLRAELSRKAQARAAEFSWQRSAEITLSHLERLYRG